MMTSRFFLGACLVAATHASAFFIDRGVTAYEYYNEHTRHYALLDGADVPFVESGAAGPGWYRTGHYLAMPSVTQGKPVCRFYSPSWNTIFHTADEAECSALQQPGSGYIFDGKRFAAEYGCTQFNTPVYRLYNNRVAFGDVNHRYTADPAVRAAMIARGWRDEGVAFCASSAGVEPTRSFEVQASTNVPLIPRQECASRVGQCVALGALPRMPNRVEIFLPPNYVVRNPAYPTGVAEVVGSDAGILWSAQPPSNVSASGSFATLSPMAFHINGAERLAGEYASMSPTYTLPGAAPAAGQPDERVFPWAQQHDRALRIGAKVLVKTLRRAQAGAHAYGHPIIQFGDASTGRSFYVSLQAFGSVTAGDFVGRDARDGAAIVSTSFRERPAFGERVSGTFTQCEADSGAACIAQRTDFTFQLRRADFAEALRRARGIDPALSGDPSNYFVGSFGFHAETYLDARLGFTVDGVSLALMPIDVPGM